jgi:ribokinase
MILVLGSVNIDLVVRGARIPSPGETVLGGHFFEAQGGKGANQAVAAARAGAKVTFVGAVGDDHLGASARSSLLSEGIDCRHLVTIPGQHTGVALILIDAQGENCISVASGANEQVSVTQLQAIPDAVWSETKVFLSCLESPWNVVREGLRMAKRRGVRTILNPAPATPEFLEELQLDDIDILTPNEQEAEALAGIRITSTEDAVQAACVLRERGCGWVIMTRGSRGVLMVGHEVQSLEALDVKAVDTTAAGDAFNGYLAAAWGSGEPLLEAARRGNIAAGMAVTRQGAQPSLPTADEIDAFLIAIRGKLG